MKKIVILIIILTTYSLAFSQDIKSVDVNYKELLRSIETKIDSLKQNPDNWNSVLELIENELAKRDSSAAKWLNDLNIDFKTFQNADSTKSSLGFSYDLNIERAKITENGNSRMGKSISLESKGNVAFNKKVNPNDFLNSKISLNFFNFGGGVVILDTNVTVKTLASWRTQMAKKYKSSEEVVNSEEWKRFNSVYSMRNSWIVKYDINAGIESNQDFSKIQNTLGLKVGASVKSWNDDNILAKWNLIDYPFAIIRRITGYDNSIKASGATIPSILLGFDYVNPINDTIRKKIEGVLKPYPRINFEIGYRTVITEVASQTIFFNCSYRYFFEIGASKKIRDNSLDAFSYFTSSLSSSSGFFVSYSYGKLPFDRQNDAVYELGLRYKFK